MARKKAEPIVRAMDFTDGQSRLALRILATVGHDDPPDGRRSVE
jgi:hypothetical protein